MTPQQQSVLDGLAEKYQSVRVSQAQPIGVQSINADCFDGPDAVFDIDGDQVWKGEPVRRVRISPSGFTQEEEV